ncbi:MAG TPA: hypothetical protein VFF65_05255, partial [Phycisphaerales bacterium]|nr:hypothetical protein [Phycisphaerales bacterium]
RLLIGADQAVALARWREPEAVVSLAEPLVMARGAEDAAPVFPVHLGNWSRRMLPTPKLDASSTAVREGLATGDEAALRRLLDARVLEYIRSNGVYTG